MASPPDGQTLLLGTAGEIAMLPLLNPAIGYDPLKTSCCSGSEGAECPGGEQRRTGPHIARTDRLR